MQESRFFWVRKKTWRQYVAAMLGVVSALAVIGSISPDFTETDHTVVIAGSAQSGDHETKADEISALDAAHAKHCPLQLSCHGQPFPGSETDLSDLSLYGFSVRDFPDQILAAGGLVAPDHRPPIG